jgi:hypothetical protein
MKVRVIRVFRVPNCDTRITRNSRTKFGFWVFRVRVRVFRVWVSGYGFFAQPYPKVPVHVLHLENIVKSCF